MEHANERSERVSDTHEVPRVLTEERSNESIGAQDRAQLHQISSNSDLLISRSPGGHASVDNGNAIDDSPLSTGDLVRILEIALAEIRANQNFIFSVLGFAAIAVSITQRMHVAGFHGTISRGFWGIGITCCAVAALWSAISRSHLIPLAAFVGASAPGEVELVLSELRTALYRAIKAVKKARILKIFVSIGVLLVACALAIEVFGCGSNSGAQPTNPRAQQQEQQ